MILNKRVFRMLKEHIWRYISVLMLIILGSWTFVVVVGLTRSLDESAINFTKQNVQEDLYFSTAKPISNIAKLEEIYNATIEEYESIDVQLSNTLTLRLLGETHRVNIPAILKGQALSDKGEILIDPAFANAHSYSLGSKIDIEGKTFTVIGFMALPQYIYPLQGANDLMALPENFGLGVISSEDFQNITNISVNYSVKFHNITQSLTQQNVNLYEQLLKEGVQISDWIPAVNNKRIQLVWTSITSLKSMSVPLSVSMFFLSCLIIGIMIWRMIRKDSVIIGTFYAQGYRRYELMHHYMTLPVGIAIIGGVIGSLLAVPCIEPAMNSITMSYILPTFKFKPDTLSVLAGILMPVFALGISSYLVIHSQLKHTAVQLMRGGKLSSKINVLERTFKLEHFRFNTKFKLREQLRSISRLIFLLLGVTSASVLILFGFAIMSSYSEVFKTGSADIYHFEYEYAFKSLHTEPVQDGVEIFNNGLFYPIDAESIEFYVIGVEPNSTYLSFRDEKGTFLSNDQTNITEALAKRLGVKAGDNVSLVNKKDGKVYVLHIDGVADSYAGQAIHIPIERFNEMLSLKENSYIGLWSMEPLEIESSELAGMKVMSEISNSVDFMLRPIIYSMACVIFIACVVAMIILYLVTSLVIEENKITISLFKVFGYKRKEIKSLILNSTTYTVIVGFIISIPIMFVSMNALFSYISSMVNVVLPAKIHPLYILICFFLIMITYELSKLICSKKLNAVSMNEALKAGIE